MGICKHYDSIAANAMGKSFDSIIHDEGNRAYWEVKSQGASRLNC